MNLLEFVCSHLVEVAASLVLLYLLPKLISSALQQWRIYSAFMTVPCDPDQHFIFGHAPRMLATAKILDWLTEMAVKTKSHVLKLNLGPFQNILVPVHPDALKVILKADPKSEEIYHSFVKWLGRGLLIANGARWARSRRLLTPAFHFNVLRPYMKVYGEAVNELVGLWAKIPEGQSFNAYPYITQLTLDVMLRCSCSYRSNCQLERNRSPYIKAVHALIYLSVKRLFTFWQYFDFIYFFTPDYWSYRTHCKIVHKFAMDLIRKRREELQELNKAGQVSRRRYLDFIDILLEAKDEAGVGLTDMEIRAEVDTFVFEGHDTAASSLIWTLYNLALHPEHQEICRKEADDIFDQKDFIEMEDLKSLEYLKYCIKESMRLFPAVPITGRILAQDTDIGGHRMPKGTQVFTNYYVVQHHPDFWEDPYGFDPLRFTPERSKGRHSHAYVPFSAGPRNCIGQEFALNEVRVIVAAILRNFQVFLDMEKPLRKECRVILRPKGLHIKLKHRSL